MFAVPGWSLPADKLKSQTGTTGPDLAAHGQANGQKDGEKKSQKRKRDRGKNIEVTGDNLGELWTKHFEKKDSKKVNTEDIDGEEQKKSKKKRRESDGHGMNGISKEASIVDKDVVERQEKKKKRKERDTQKVTGTDAGERPEKKKKRTGKDDKQMNGKDAGSVDGDSSQDVMKRNRVNVEVVNRIVSHHIGHQGEPKKNKRERAKEKWLTRQSETNDASQVVVIDDGKIDFSVSGAEEILKDALSPEITEQNSMKDSRDEIEPTAKEPEVHSLAPKDDEGRAKYERRKAKAEKRRLARELKQANGELPPPRPEASTEEPLSKAQKKKSKEADTTATTQPVQPTPTQMTKPSTTKLTPLQAKMAAKLTSARFRHLNETLYTTPSSAALSLFTNTPSAYSSYHAGFRAQVAVWPSNPIVGFISDIKARGGVRRDRGSQSKAFRGQKGKKKDNKKSGDREDEGDGRDAMGRMLEPLPRTKGVCTIADLGCGDATLAGVLTPLAPSSKLNLKILSFDLAKGDSPNADLITVADTTDLASAGVTDGSVDVAICCLSLMGTNWVSVVDECSRVVHPGGEVWVAEIRSRFARKEEVKKRVEHSVGNLKKKPKKKMADEGEDDDAPLALEELEEPSGKMGDDTDVSAFVAIWQKRGFGLKGEPDASNKMFVTMRFVREKAVRDEGGNFITSRARLGMEGKKFIEKEKVVEDKVDEGRVLKPCVYKTR